MSLNSHVVGWLLFQMHSTCEESVAFPLAADVQNKVEWVLPRSPWCENWSQISGTDPSTCKSLKTFPIKLTEVFPHGNITYLCLISAKSHSQIQNFLLRFCHNGSSAPHSGHSLLIGDALLDKDAGNKRRVRVIFGTRIKILLVKTYSISLAGQTSQFSFLFPIPGRKIGKYCHQCGGPELRSILCS